MNCVLYSPTVIALRILGAMLRILSSALRKHKIFAGDTLSCDKDPKSFAEESRTYLEKSKKCAANLSTFLRF